MLLLNNTYVKVNLNHFFNRALKNRKRQQNPFTRLLGRELENNIQITRLSGMHVTDMGLDMTSTDCCFRAVRTTKAFFPSVMITDVHGQVILLGGAVTAVRTLEGFFPSVGSDMPYQLGLGGCAITAVGTTVRLLSGVGSDVYR